MAAHYDGSMPEVDIQGIVDGIDAGVGGPRYGEVKISKELNKKLRRNTPSQANRDMVNEDVVLPMPDPAPWTDDNRKS